ncbi:MAG: hypothetical protein JXA21_00305 [Anaerolineae bacterium]|nr:hypothetical protein [Anaerolineae bacterium]
MSEKENYLNMISIAYYVVAAIAGLFACFPLIHFVIGLLMLTGGLTSEIGSEAAPIVLMGGIFTGFAGIVILLGWAFAIAIFFTGRSIAKRRRHTFCVVMSAIACMFVPFGTVLGVLSLILLLSPEVQAAFTAPQTYE